MEQQDYTAWLESRESIRNELFGEVNDADWAPSYSNLTMPLAELALQTSMRYKPTNAENAARLGIYSGVAAIIAAHAELAASQEPANAIYGFTSPESQLVVTDMTARVVYRWERVCQRRRQTSPFASLPMELSPGDFARPDVQLVIETSTAILEILAAGYPPGKPDSPGRQNLVSFFAIHGPAYARAWIRGDFIRDYCEEQSIDPDLWLTKITPKKRAEYARNLPHNPMIAVERLISRYAAFEPDNIQTVLGWNKVLISKVFTPGRIHALAERSGSEPESLLLQVKSNLEDTLSTRNIAATLGLTPLEADEFLSLSERAVIAVASADPLQAIQRIAHHLRVTLSTQNLCSELGWSPERVDAVFPARKRKDIAIRSTDPLMKIRDIIRISNDLADFGLEPEFVMKIATSWPHQARAIAARVKREIASPPPYTSHRVWSWIVVNSPKAERRTWLTQAAAYKVFRQITGVGLSTVRLGAADHWFNLHNIATNEPPAPPDGALDSSSAANQLLDLTELAGIDEEVLEKLLSHFSEDPQAPLSGELHATLELLRHHADKLPDQS